MKKRTLILTFTILVVIGIIAERPVHASTPPPWTVTLDANSTGPTDANPQATNTVVKSFNIGAIINASSTQPLNNVFGWQFGIIYDPTVVVPQGDPTPAAANDLGQNTATFGAQTGPGNPNWAGMLATNHAFGNFAIQPPIDTTHQEIFAYFTFLNPTPAMTIAPTLSPAVRGNLLANLAFELVGRPGPVSFTITDVLFVDQSANVLPSIVAGPPVTVTINNSPPVASFTATPLPRGDPSCTPITGAACSANAIRYDGSASSATAPNSIANPAGYFWDFGDGFQDNTNNPSCGLLVCNQGPIAIHDYGVPGKFTTTLRVADSPAGATGSARDALGNPIINNQPSHRTLTLRVGNSTNQPPIVSFTESTTTATTFSNVALTISASDTDGTLTSIIVVWGDGTVYSVPVTQTFVGYGYPRAGTYAVYVNATDDEGATTQSPMATKTIINRPPSVSFTESATAALKGTAVSINITATDPDGTVTSIQVNWGDGTVDTLPNTATTDSHIYSVAGTYFVYVSATDNSGATGQSAFAAKTIFDHPPIVSFTESVTSALTGTPITILISISDPTGIVTSLKVSWGDGTVDTLPGNATGDTHVYNSTGNDFASIFRVYVNATDSSGLTNQSGVSTKIIFDRPPTTNFTESATQVSTGTPITLNFFASDPDGTISALTVSWGDGTIHTLPGSSTSDTHTYASPGQFIVRVNATDNSGSIGSSYSVKTVTGTPAPPSVSFTESATTVPTGIAIILTITVFDPNRTVNSITVYWGDGSVHNLPGTATSDGHAYASTGSLPSASFLVYAIATDNAGLIIQSPFVTKTVTDRPPTAAFTFTPISPSVGQTVSFNASPSNDPDGTIFTYTWDFGDGTIGSGVTPTHVYTATLMGKVILVVIDNSGSTGTAQSAISVQQSGGHASLFSWGVRPQWKKFSVTKQGPIEPIQAFAVNDGNSTLWAYVQFKITRDGGVNLVLNTQVVQLTPGQQINGNQDPRFAIPFTPTVPSTYTAQATVYYSASSTIPPIGDPSFTANLAGQKSASFTVSS